MAEGYFRARKGLTVANSSGSANLSPTTLTIGTTIGNSTGIYTGVVNATSVNSGAFTVGALFTANSILTNAAAVNITGQTNTATIFATTSANVGANVQITTALLKIGNTTANLQGSSILVSLANASSTANLTPISLNVGNTTANQLVNSTASVITNSTFTLTQTPNLISLGNTIANITANSILFRVINATASANISPSTIAVPNVAISGALTANGGVGSSGQVLRSDGTKSYWGDPAATAAGGSTTEIQYNSGGAFAGNNLFNFTAATTTVTLGSATANVQANATLIRVINSSSSANLSPAGLVAPNVAISGVLSANGGIGSPGQILKTDGSAKVYWADQSAANPSGSNKMIQINDNGSFGANAWFTFDITTTTMVIGNSTINSVHSSSKLTFANATNSANLDPVQLVIGTSTVNNVVLAAGANVVLGVNDLRVGTAASNSYANSSMVRVANASGSANITPTNILVSNVTLTGALSANGGVGITGDILKSDGTKSYWGAATATVAANGSTTEIQYNQGGSFAANNNLTYDQSTGTLTTGNTTSNVQANSTQLKVANSTQTANLSPLALSIGIAKVNATMVVVGSNLTISAADMKIGNSTANTTQNSVIFQVSNATGTANLDPVQLVIGSSKVNTTTHSVGANVILDSTQLFVGNSSVNSITSATLMRLSDSAGEATLVPTSITFGNTIANVQANGTSLRVINATSSANLDPSQLTIGISKVNSTMIAVGANLLVNSSVLLIGNGSVNIQINSSFFNGTANNANFLGGVAADSYVDFSDLTGFQTEAGLAANVATMDANYATTALNANNASYLGGTTYLDYQLESGMAGNVATLTANNTAWVGAVTAANVVSNAQLIANLALFQTSAGLSANVAKLTANNTLYLGSTIAASYQLNSTLSANVATMTANNSTYFGGTLPAAYQTAAGLSANVAVLTSNNTLYLGGTVASSYQLNSTLSANVAKLTANNTSFLGGVDAANYMRIDTADQAVTGGGRITELDLGNSGTGTITPDPGDRPMQKYTNNGAHTLAPGTNYGNYYLTILNGSGAGATTTSGWTKVTGTLTTTVGHKFRCGCSITADASLLSIQALQ